MKKLVIGITCIALITPYFYENYQEYTHNLPPIAGKLISKERIDNNMPKKVGYCPGHGKKTKNKTAPDGTPEWMANRKVADYFAIELKNNGIQGYDLTEGSEDDISRVVRAKRANAWGAHIVVAIHTNALYATPRWQTQARGIETWYTSNQGLILARYVQKALIQETKQVNRKYQDASSKNWTILEDTKMPAILVEMGFEDNKIDYALIYKAAADWYCKAIARAICMGVCDYFGMSYSSKPLASETKEESILIPNMTSDILKNVKAFQKTHKLEQDGIIGPKTWAVLMQYVEDCGELVGFINHLKTEITELVGE